MANDILKAPERNKFIGSVADALTKVKAKTGVAGEFLIGGDASFATKSAIPPEALEIMQSGKWVPLK